MSNQNGEANAETGANAQDNSTNLDFEARLKELESQLEAEKKSKERILNESKEYKEKFQAYKSKEETFLEEQKKAEESRLREQGEYKTLLEQREQQLEELKSSLEKANGETDSYKQSIVNLRKASAFERELGGKLKKDSYWTHVDFDKIAVNPENGEIDKASLKTVADGFIKEYKELVSFPVGGNMPNGTPSGSSGKLTYEQWQKLPLKDRKKRMKDVVN